MRGPSEVGSHLDVPLPAPDAKQAHPGRPLIAPNIVDPSVKFRHLPVDDQNRRVRSGHRYDSVNGARLQIGAVGGDQVRLLTIVLFLFTLNPTKILQGCALKLILTVPRKFNKLGAIHLHLEG